MLELILAFILGILAGTITGLTPGIHINLVSLFLISAFPSISPIPAIVFIVSMSITHTFLDFIPSIFLGAPDSDSSLSVLPGHELLLQGQGYKAVILTSYGCLSGILIILILTPLFLIYLSQIFPYFKLIMPFILIFSSAFLIIKEEKSIFLALLVFFLSGFLGIAVFQLPLKDPLLPLLTGLFGASSLITSIAKKQKLPAQERIFPKFKLAYLKSLLSSFIASPLCSFLPALGSGQAAVIASNISDSKEKEDFLVLLGSINIIVLGLSFVTLYSINKARTGVSASIQQIGLSLSQLPAVLIAIIISGILAFFLTIILAKIFSKTISRINYSILSIAVLSILTAVVFIFSGFLGLLVFIFSTLLGILTISLAIRRTHMLGSLMLSTILYYLI
jgi:putative membrane protein